MPKIIKTTIRDRDGKTHVIRATPAVTARVQQKLQSLRHENRTGKHWIADVAADAYLEQLKYEDRQRKALELFNGR